MRTHLRPQVRRFLPAQCRLSMLAAQRCTEPSVAVCCHVTRLRLPGENCWGVPMAPLASWSRCAARAGLMACSELQGTRAVWHRRGSLPCPKPYAGLLPSRHAGAGRWTWDTATVLACLTRGSPALASRYCQGATAVPDAQRAACCCHAPQLNHALTLAPLTAHVLTRQAHLAAAFP